MTDEDAFRAAIHSAHWDELETPRLVYADWLEEHDRLEEAAAQRLLACPAGYRAVVVNLSGLVRERLRLREWTYAHLEEELGVDWLSPNTEVNDLVPVLAAAHDGLEEELDLHPDVTSWEKFWCLQVDLLPTGTDCELLADRAARIWGHGYGDCCSYLFDSARDAWDAYQVAVNVREENDEEEEEEEEDEEI